MKQTKKLLAFVAIAVMLVIFGCISIAAINDGETVDALSAGPDHTVAPGESFYYVDNTGMTWEIENPSTEKTLTAHYYSEYDRYAFGVYTIVSKDVSWTYGQSGDLNETDWTSQPAGYTVGYNYFGTFDANASTAANTPAGTHINDAVVEISFAGDSDGVYKPFTQESFIINATWGTVTIYPADMTVTGIDYNGIYDAAAHAGTVAATTVDGCAPTIKFGTAADACTEDSISYTNVGVYTVYYKVTAPNHKDVTGSLTVTITEKDIADAVITLDQDSLVYNAAEQTITINSVVVDGLTLALTTDYTIATGSDKGTDVLASGYTLTINGCGNFTGTATKAWSIVQNQVNNITSITAPGWTYNDTTLPAHAATADFGTPVLTYSDDGVNFGALPANPHAGTWTVKAYVAETDNYVAAEDTATFVVAKDTWEGTPAVDYTKPVYNGTEQTIAPTFSGIPTESYLATSVNTTYGMTHAGSVVVTTTLTYDNYEDVVFDWNAEITPAPITILTNSATMAYGSAEWQAEGKLTAPGYTIVSGQVYGTDEIFAGTPTYSFIKYIDATNVTYDAPNHPTRVLYGSVANEILSYSPNTDYLVTITEGTLTLTPAHLTIHIDDRSNDTHIYNGYEQSYKPTYIGKPVGFIGDDKGGIDTTTFNLVKKDVGEWFIDADTFTLYANNQTTGDDVSLCYDLTVIGTAVFSIKPRPIEITLADASTIYGDVAPALGVATPESAVMVGTDTYADLNLVITADYTAVTDVVGEYDITATYTNANYQVTFVKGTLYVNPKPINVTIGDETITYGETPDYSDNATVDAADLVGADTLAGLGITIADNAAGAYNAGTYEINSVISSNANYVVTPVYTQGSYSVLTVEQKAITMTSDDITVTYGDAIPTYTFQTAGMIGAETILGAVDYDCVYVVGTGVGTYEIKFLDEAAISANNPNYAITFAYGTLTVDPKAILVPINPETITYGDAEPAYSADFTGLLVGADVIADIAYACDYDVTDAAKRGVGTYIISASAVATSNPNYIVAFEDATLTVEQKAITLDIADKTVVYGNAAPAFTLETPVAGVLAFDDTMDALTVVYTCVYDPAHAVNKNVGTYAITGTCTDANYIVTLVDGELTVTPCILTGEVFDVIFADAVYSGVAQSPVFESLLIKGEAIDAAHVAFTASETNAATYSVAISIVGGNYAGSTGTADWTIAPYAISSVIWNGGSFVYNGLSQGPIATAQGPAGETIYISSTEKILVGEHEAFAKDIIDDPSYISTNYRLVKIGMGTGFYTIEEATPVRFTSASVTIGDSYAINFKVPVLAFEQYGVSAADAVVSMTVKGVTTVVPQTDIDTIGGVEYYVFSYADIAPQNMGEEVLAEVKIAEKTNSRTYSVETYCYNQLAENAADLEFATVLVALLRYSATAQLHVDAATPAEELVTYKLTTDPALKVMNDIVTVKGTYVNNNKGGWDPTSAIVGHTASVVLNNGVSLTYYIDTNNVDVADLTVTVDGITYKDLSRDENGRYYVEIPTAFATCCDMVDIDVYIGTTHVAFADFSVEGYAVSQNNDLAKALVDFGAILADYLA